MSMIQVKASGLMCSFCTMSVEKALARIDGVRNVQVNLVHGIILVDANPKLVNQQDIARGVESLGYTIVATEAQQLSTDEAIFSTIKKRGFLALALAIAILPFDTFNLFGVGDGVRTIVSGMVAAIVLVWIGQPILVKTFKAIRQRVINANVLLSTGAWGAFGIGVAHLFDGAQWPNFFPVATWLLALHLFFGYFKLGTRKAAAESVRRLLSLQTERATVIRGGKEIVLPAAEVQPGEMIVVRPGEHVPLDGVVRDGESSIDMSSVTGESVPVYREVGSEVVGGTLNLDGFLKIEVSRAASEGYIAQVVRLMRQIEEKKPPIQLLMDRLMNYYGPVVFIVAALATVGWLIYEGSFSQAVLIGLTTIIMGYPCALGITTPMVLAIGGGHGIARGLLVRAGEFFQALAEVDVVAFDKTGTLTYGRPTVREVIAFHGTPNQVLSTIVAAEVRSEHPLAGAIVRYAELQEVRWPDATDFRAIPGKGVIATVAGRRIIVGRRSLVESEGAVFGHEENEQLRSLEERGHTVVYAVSDGKPLGAVALQDVPRPGAAQALARLHKLGIQSVLLTGDNQPVAEAIGRQVGIDQVHAELLPAEKVQVIERLQRTGRKVAMVGDGINDAPALVQSDVGIALGAGTDVAMESAGVVLVSDQLDKVVASILLGRASHAKMKHNIGIAVVSNVVGMALAILGLITVTMAIAIMTASIFAVLLSTLSLIRLKLDDSNASSDDSDVVEIIIPAKRMHCENCSRTINRELTAAKGVRKVIPDVGRKEVLVAYRPDETNEETLRHRLEQLGFR